jgi:nucleoside-diphosphate-sugar epimerase
VTDPDSLERLAQEHPITSIIHAAALTPRSHEDEVARGRSVLDVNFMGTVNLLQLALSLPALTRFVYVSSTSVYGAWLTRDRLVEDLPLAPEGLYSIAKYASELTCSEWSRLYGLDIVSVRLGSVYGPWERITAGRTRMSTVYEVVHHALAGHEIKINGLEESTDWVHAHDVAMGIVLLLDAPTLHHRVYNLGSGVIHSAGDILTTLATIRPQTKYRVVTEQEANICIDRGYQETETDLSRIIAYTGFRPRYSLHDGLAHYVGWLQGAREALATK